MRHLELVAKANKSVEEAAAGVRTDFRLHYHFQPQAHWMNDPNGLVFFQGYYHVFFQHNPYGAEWGNMHWGHARTRDFLTWEHLPIALAPSEPYDLDGCFSGSAVVEDGQLHLFYTGVRQVHGQLVQVQCRAVSRDGLHFEKDPANPLISSIPPEGSGDFRDPKVWFHGGTWYMAVGSGGGGRGKVLLYKSKDLRAWAYVGIAAESDGSQGVIWECPDLFPLGDKYVLLVSPIGIEPRRVLYFVGSMDYETGQFQADSAGVLDKGPDFYAPQTFFVSERRLMLAWMQSWEGPFPSQKHNWAGAFTLPRELSLDSAGRLRVCPAAEVDRFRENLAARFALAVEDGAEHDLVSCDLSGRGLEVVLRVNRRGTTASEYGIKFKGPRGQAGFVVGVRGGRLLFVDLGSWGQKGVFTAELTPVDAEFELRVFVDRSSLEVFGEGEAACITSRVYPPSPVLVPQLFAVDGILKAEIELWSFGGRSGKGC